jgi:ABC-type transport system substrate-binding protein
MRRRRTFSSLVALGLVLAACTGASPSPSGSAAPSAEASRAPFVAESYPAAGATDCAYGGEFKQIKAVDELTVEFDLCNPDPAFLPKLALASNEIQDSAYLAANMANHLILARPNGTGPYKFGEYVRGDHITLVRNDSYWGTKAKAAQVIFQWNSEAAARLLALQAGTVDGIDNPGPDDFATISGDSSLQLLPREALNTMYVGMTNTFKPFDNQKVRQALAMGIDRQRIIDNFYPTGSSVADYFTPCAITNACEGTKWYAFDKAAAKTLLDQGLAEEGMPTGGFATKLYYRDVVRGYLPDPNVVAQDIQAQLKANLNIDITIEVQASGTFLDNSSAGLLDGLYLLGWGADYPDVTNFLDYHFNNVGNKQFGPIPAAITDPLKADATTADPAARKAAVTEANNAIRDFVPMIPIAHGGSATAWKADVTGAHSSPLTEEVLAAMDPGGRATLVFMQNAYPISLYCGDETDGETIRVCNQIGETLYTWEIGTANVVPGLAESCDTNADLTVWTCHLHSGVTFHDGARLDANDVVDTFAVQWDLDNPLHIGRKGVFEYWGGLYGPFLNTPAS